jgi:hypothetical protein
LPPSPKCGIGSGPPKRETEGIEEAWIRLCLSTRFFNVIEAVQYLVVAVILKKATVKFVRAAFGNVVDDRALVATVLRRKVVRDYLKLWI